MLKNIFGGYENPVYICSAKQKTPHTMKEYIEKIIESVTMDIILNHIPVESEPEGDMIAHEIEELMKSRFEIVSKRIEHLEGKVNAQYKRNEALTADIAILDKKHDFLMDILTDSQVEEYQQFCEEHGF